MFIARMILFILVELMALINPQYYCAVFHGIAGNMDYPAYRKIMINVNFTIKF
ncbi:hypothetical protein SAMN05518672_107168 [Chitinophaga sp. CF118]|nr:hypothetical protein SAMN05518672_107168 [Chitinophaga sp. CF118]